MNLEQLEEKVIRFYETGEQQGKNFVMMRDRNVVICNQKCDGHIKSLRILIENNNGHYKIISKQLVYDELVCPRGLEECPAKCSMPCEY